MFERAGETPALALQRLARIDVELRIGNPGGQANDDQHDENLDEREAASVPGSHKSHEPISAS